MTDEQKELFEKYTDQNSFKPGAKMMREVMEEYTSRKHSTGPNQKQIISKAVTRSNDLGLNDDDDILLPFFYFCTGMVFTPKQK